MRGGLLKTTEGALFARENGRIVRVQVPAPTDATKMPLVGKGWTLELKPQWKLAAEGRPGTLLPGRSMPRRTRNERREKALRGTQLEDFGNNDMNFAV